MQWRAIYRRGIPFDELEKEQKALLHSVQINPDTAYLLVSEPLPTYTAGNSAPPGDLLWSKEKLEENSITVSPVSRGGRWTFHGPGQIVIYPIVHLRTLGYSSKEIRGFLTDLRNSVSAWIREHGVPTHHEENPFGIYCDGKKLVSFGISVSRGVVHHGLALYLEDQSRYFLGINPCGASHIAATHLRQHGVAESWEELASQLVESIKKGFKSPKTSVVLENISHGPETIFS